MFNIYRSEAALTPLREAWEQGDDALRAAISQAAHALDLQLTQNPQEQGESRDGQARILFQAPVAILFEVDENRKLVRILRSWAYSRVADTDGRRG